MNKRILLHDIDFLRDAHKGVFDFVFPFCLQRREDVRVLLPCFEVSKSMCVLSGKHLRTELA